MEWSKYLYLYEESASGKILFRWCVIHTYSGEVKDPLIVIGLNPSGNTQVAGDNAVGFVKREVMHVSRTAQILRKVAEKNRKQSLILFNITPVVEPKASKLKTRKEEILDAHPLNLEKIREVLDKYNVSKRAPVLLCYGGAYARISKEQDFLKDILGELDGHPVKCLGVTEKRGLPRHPIAAQMSGEEDYLKLKAYPPRKK